MQRIKLNCCEDYKTDDEKLCFYMACLEDYNEHNREENGGDLEFKLCDREIFLYSSKYNKARKFATMNKDDSVKFDTVDGLDLTDGFNFGWFVNNFAKKMK